MTSPIQWSTSYIRKKEHGEGVKACSLVNVNGHNELSEVGELTNVSGNMPALIIRRLLDSSSTDTSKSLHRQMHKLASLKLYLLCLLRLALRTCEKHRTSSMSKYSMRYIQLTFVLHP
jgi:hypothetical protein